MNKTKYNGVIPAFYACYDDEGNISPERVLALTRYLIGKGVNGLYVGGSSGECIYQSVAERKVVLENVMAEAKDRGCTRATICMERGADVGRDKPVIFAIGNAPTALVRLCELIDAGEVRPALIIGAPVGFVNVVESKEMVMERDVPFIVPKGRKGGSNIAATICNSMIYYKG